MRKFNAVLATLSTGLMVTAGSVFAADPPATATALAQSVDLSDAKGAGLIIVGLMVTAGVVLWGARLVMSKFKPKI